MTNPDIDTLFALLGGRHKKLVENTRAPYAVSIAFDSFG